MKSLTAALGAAAIVAVFAAPALAADASDLDARLARVEQQLAQQSAPSARETQSAVDAYLASAQADASLVAGPGSAGYDGGFWIRGGSFLLKINLTIQARYEWWDWDDNAQEVFSSSNGDLSGYSLPRVTLRLSGDATCDIHYYAQFEFGQHGSWFNTGNDPLTTGSASAGYGDYPDIISGSGSFGAAGVDEQAMAFSIGGGECREAWIEYEPCPMFALRMGLIQTAATRQLMTPPEMQQFIDISLASSYIGQLAPGYSDRNRDFGVMLHGVLGCDGEWSYMLTATNGDGPIGRNIFSGETDDNLAYSARINWDLRGHMGYEEGALRQSECDWTAAVGAWAYIYNDVRNDHTHDKYADRVLFGADLALGYGGFSFTGAYNHAEYSNSSDAFGINGTGWSWFAQLGYLFCGTAWEIAGRYGQQSHEFDDNGAGATETYGASEWGVVINYYIDGHADKLSADVSFITADDLGNLNHDVYAGYHVSGDTDAMLVRFQWQLAL
jgi:hypothetical protein